MTPSPDDRIAPLLARLRQVQQALGLEPTAPDPQVRFADALDSMGMVEFLALLARDCGVTPAAIEESVGRTFTTVSELARALHAAGIVPRPEGGGPPRPSALSAVPATCWLAATAVCLPEAVQPASQINEALDRPPGWLEAHAGIESRWTWADQDPLAAAAAAGRECAAKGGMPLAEIGALLVASEAPPLLAGLAAALHHRLELPAETVALESGGACTGFLAALWTGRRLLPQAGVVLVIAVEAHTRYLHLKPGPAGEAAALFGDAAAAVLLCSRPAGEACIPVVDVMLGADGGQGSLLRLERPAEGGVELHMDGTRLAARAIRAMAQAVRALAADHGLTPADLVAIVAHGGNGRMPALLARQLSLPEARVWSETRRAGNLGSATLPVAWAAHPPTPDAVVWTAVGAGLTWGAALTGRSAGSHRGGAKLV